MAGMPSSSPLSEFLHGVLLAAAVLGFGTCAVINAGCTCEPIVLDVSGRDTETAGTAVGWDRLPTTSDTYPGPGGEVTGGDWQLTEVPDGDSNGGTETDTNTGEVCGFGWPSPFADLDTETLTGLCESIVMCGYDAATLAELEPCVFTASAWLGDPEAVGNVPTWRLVLHAATSAVVASYNADPWPWPKPNGHGLDCAKCVIEIQAGIFPMSEIGQCGTNVSEVAPWLCWAEGMGL